jgi:S1-C subfamily serine protease
MTRVTALIAIALASAAISASIAEVPPAVAIGVAFNPQDNVAKVAEVRPGSMGDRMGIRAGDVITHGNGKRTNNLAKLKAFIRSLKPGDPVELTVKRKGETLQLKGIAAARSS